MLRCVVVSLTRSGLRHKVRLVAGNCIFPSHALYAICLNCQGTIQGHDQAFPILATGEIGRNLAAWTRRQPIDISPYRFSEDLDFTLREPQHLDANFLKGAFSESGSHG